MGRGTAGDGASLDEVEAAKAPQAQGSQQAGGLPEPGALDPGSMRETAGAQLLLEVAQTQLMEEPKGAAGEPMPETTQAAETGWFLLAGQSHACI
jgi:hypothetical protein